MIEKVIRIRPILAERWVGEEKHFQLQLDITMHNGDKSWEEFTFDQIEGYVIGEAGLELSGEMMMGLLKKVKEEIPKEDELSDIRKEAAIERRGRCDMEECKETASLEKCNCCTYMREDLPSEWRKDMESPACPCGEQPYYHTIERHDMILHTMMCKKCGLGVVDDTQEEAHKRWVQYVWKSKEEAGKRKLKSILNSVAEDAGLPSESRNESPVAGSSSNSYANVAEKFGSKNQQGDKPIITKVNCPQCGSFELEIETKVSVVDPRACAYIPKSGKCSCGFSWTTRKEFYDAYLRGTLEKKPTPPENHDVYEDRADKEEGDTNDI